MTGSRLNEITANRITTRNPQDKYLQKRLVWTFLGEAGKYRRRIQFRYDRRGYYAFSNNLHNTR